MSHSKLQITHEQLNTRVIYPPGGRKCFLCGGSGFYRAVNQRAKACPACISGVIPEEKELDYEHWSGSGCWWDKFCADW